MNATNKNFYILFITLLILLGRMYAVDPNTVVATINVGVNPAGLAVTPDNHFVYVANNNNYDIAGQDSVSVFDATTQLPIMTIFDSSFNEPYTVTINSQGTIAYVTNSAGSTITMIDLLNNTVVGVITGFDGPSGMAIMPDGTKAYVNNYGGPILGSGNGKTIRVVDLATNTIVGSPITVGLAPAALALSPDGEFLYTVNYVDGNPGTGTMSVVRTSDNAVVATIPGFSGPFAIAISPDGNFAYVTNFGSNNFAPFGTTVSVVDLNSNMISATVDVAIQPSGAAIFPDGRFVLITNYNTLYAGSNFSDLTAGQGTVNVIDTATNEVVAPTIPVGESPANIAISSNGEFAFVSNYTSNTVSVIALQSFKLTAKGCKIKDKHSKKVTNKLTWKASGTSLPVSYSIYRDENLTDLVVTLPGTATEYLDRNVNSKKKYTYYIIGINGVGTTSVPVMIKVKRECK